jgi:hypothetical protein
LSPAPGVRSLVQDTRARAFSSSVEGRRHVSEQSNLGTPEGIGGALLTLAFFGASMWLMVRRRIDKRRQLRLEDRFCQFCGAGHLDLDEARYCTTCGKEIMC